MATTPEGRVKDKVKKALRAKGVLPFAEVAGAPHKNAVGTYYMPVAGQFSVRGVHDFVGCWNGVFFSLETKAPNNPDDETKHQGDFRVAITRCGGIALTGVRDADSAVDAVERLVMKRKTT